MLAAAPFLFSCNQKKIDTLEGQVSTLSAENTEYQRIMEERDAQINDFFSTFNEIEANLEEMKTSEGIVTANLNGESNSQKENIKSSITTLNELIQKNKGLVADLEKKYKNANFKIKEMDNMIASLNENINEKEAELVALRNDLEN